MASWVVSAHGGKDKKNSKIRQILAPTEKFKYGVTMVPGGMELVMFTPQAQIFYGGDPELDALIAGNESDSVIQDRIHKVKTGGSIIPDYTAYGTTDFRSGVYVVGSGGSGTIAIELSDGSTRSLSKIFTDAHAHNVNRIYWLCCTCLHP